MAPEDRQSTTVRPLVVPEIVTFPAEADLTNALELGIQLICAFGPDVAVVIADMTATEFCDTAAIRYLIVANDVAIESEAELRVVAPGPAVLRAMQTLGVDRALRLYASMTDALSGGPVRASRQTHTEPSDAAQRARTRPLRADLRPGRTASQRSPS